MYLVMTATGALPKTHALLSERPGKVLLYVCKMKLRIERFKYR